MPISLAFAGSISNTGSSKKTRIGGNDTGADLERLLPRDDLGSGEPGDVDDESDLEGVVGGKKGTESEETVVKDDHIKSSTSSTSAAVVTTSARLGEMGTDEQNGIKFEGRAGDGWARSVAWV